MGGLGHGALLSAVGAVGAVDRTLATRHRHGWSAPHRTTSRGRPRTIPTCEAPLIPCRCKWLNTLSGRAASDYVSQHLDVVRDEGNGRRVVSCPEGAASFVLEPDTGVYGGDEQVRLRRLDR